MQKCKDKRLFGNHLLYKRTVWSVNDGLSGNLWKPAGNLFGRFTLLKIYRTGGFRTICH